METRSNIVFFKPRLQLYSFQVVLAEILEQKISYLINLLQYFINLLVPFLLSSKMRKPIKLEQRLQELVKSILALSPYQLLRLSQVIIPFFYD